MSFCRITGRARGLPKPNFFPIIPPVSPADAAKLCRITGKRADKHGFVPLIEPGRKPQTKCPVTGREPAATDEAAVAAAREALHSTRRDFKYLRPVLRRDAVDKADLRAFDDLQRVLKKVGKENMSADSDVDGYVYPLPSILASLVVPPAVEEAIRRGDVEAVSLSKTCDRVVFKVKGKRTVFLPLEPCGEIGRWLDGQGQNAETLKRQRQAEEAAKKKRGIWGDQSSKKVFEALEKKAGEAAAKEKEQWDQHGKKGGRKPSAFKARAFRDALEAFKAKYTAAGNMESLGDVADALYTNLSTLDFEAAARHAKELSKLVRPAKKKVRQRLKGKRSRPKNVYVPDHPGLELVPLMEGETLTPMVPEINPKLIDLVVKSKTEDFDRNSSLKSMFADEESLKILPTLEEFCDIGHALQSGLDGVSILRVGCVYDRGDGVKFADDPGEVGPGANIIVGAVVETANSGGPKFVPGEMIADQFTPGQRMSAVNGEFIPGASVRAGDGRFQFIPGVLSRGSFVAGQFMTGEDRKPKFVKGQVVHTKAGSKFVEGETVVTADGIKMVAG